VNPSCQMSFALDCSVPALGGIYDRVEPDGEEKDKAPSTIGSRGPRDLSRQ
jgi:hypothetical protein